MDAPLSLTIIVFVLLFRQINILSALNGELCHNFDILLNCKSLSPKLWISFHLLVCRITARRVKKYRILVIWVAMKKIYILCLHLTKREKEISLFNSCGICLIIGQKSKSSTQIIMSNLKLVFLFFSKESSRLPTSASSTPTLPASATATATTAPSYMQLTAASRIRAKGAAALLGAPPQRQRSRSPPG